MGYGNLAYKEEYVFDEIPQKTKQKTTENKSKKAPENKKVHLSYISWTLAIASAAIFMVSSFVTVHDTRLEVSRLNSQLQEMKTVTNQKAFELEKSVNLSQIETEATTRLDMQRPENYQYVYVNVKREDTIEKTANGEESFAKNFGEALGKIFGNIVSIFSIE